MSFQQLTYTSERLRADATNLDLVAQPHNETPDPGVLKEHLHHGLPAQEVLPVTGQDRQEHLFLLAEMGGSPLLPELEEGLCGFFGHVGVVARGGSLESSSLHQ